MNRTATAIIAAIMTCATAAAQDTIRHQFSVNAGGGGSWFQSRPTLGESHGNWTGTAGLGYHYVLNRHWWFTSGINFAIYNASISIDNAEQTHPSASTHSGHSMEFTARSAAYNEKQQSMMLNIPLMAQYLRRGEKKTALYTAFGFKVGIPLSTKVTPEGTFVSTAHYPDLMVTYDEHWPDYGLVVDQKFSESKKRIDMNPSIMASLEVGAQWLLKETSSLYAGVYTDFGINKSLDRKEATHNSLVEHQADNPEEHIYNTATDAYARKMAPLTVGVTVRWILPFMR